MSLVLNPVHDYMRCYKMKEKRRYLSRSGRVVASVWNQGRRGESHHPWSIFHDGQERTVLIREARRPFADQPDLRVGILDLEAVR